MKATSLLLAGFLLSQNTLAATAVFCAEASGKQKKPLLTVKAGAGNTLFLCAVNSKREKGRLDVSGLKVFRLTRGGKKSPRPIFSSDLKSKPYAAAARGKELVLTELIWTGKGRVPGFETALSCDGTGCTTGVPICVFQKPTTVGVSGRKVLQAIEDFTNGKKQGKVPDSKLINRLAALAYTGDEEASKVFNDRGGMALDGDSSERYYEHQETLERLRKAGCFP